MSECITLLLYAVAVHRIAETTLTGVPDHYRIPPMLNRIYLLFATKSLSSGARADLHSAVGVLSLTCLSR